jgi:hypothetical protein
MRKLLRLQLTVLFFVIAFYSVYAFASSETSALPSSGEGASPISGWAVANVQYRLGQDASKIAAVEFDLDSPATLVQVKLTSSSATFFPCENVNGTHWLCNLGSQVSVASSDEFRVIATGNE